MRIFIGFDGRVHGETKAMVAKNFETLAQKLKPLGFETESALQTFREGRAILGAIGDGMVRTTEGNEFYEKALRSHDSPLVGYSFSSDYRAVLSIKTVLNHFHELIVQHNPDLLTLLYRREKALMDTERLKTPGQRVKQTPEEILMMVEHGILKDYAPKYHEEVDSTIFCKWFKPQAHPIFIPEGVKVIGGLKPDGDKDRYTNDIFYHPFLGNLDVDHVAMHDSVEEIGDKAFEHCVNLQTVVVSKNLKRIGINAFLGCKALSYLDLYPGLATIGEEAFHGCINLKKIRFHGTNIDLEKIKNILVKAFDKDVKFQTNDDEVHQVR